MGTNKVMVIMNNRQFDHFLIKKLEKSGIECFKLSPDYSNDISIRSHSCHHIRQCVIEIKQGVSIRIQDISGIIILDHSSLIASKNKNQDDRYFYKKSGWLAFWLHALQQSPTTINAIHHQMLSPSYFCLPRLYRLMQHYGIKVPDYHFSSSGLELCEHRLFMNCLGVHSDFSNKIDNRFFSIDKKPGLWIMVLCYGQKVDAILHEKNVPVAISEDLKVKVLKVCQELTFDIAEWLFLFRDNDWIAYGVTAWPNWSIWAHRWHDIAKTISFQIKSASSDRARIKLKKAIPPLTLPHYNAVVK